MIDDEAPRRLVAEGDEAAPQTSYPLNLDARHCIEEAVQLAEAHGWTFRKGGGHALLVGKGPAHSREGCAISVWSTPRNPENHAKQILRAVQRCLHGPEGP